MTNRQSNIIFYSLIFTVAFGLIINHFHPGFFDDINKSQDERTAQAAIEAADYPKALASYNTLINKSIRQHGENSLEAAKLYEKFADISALNGNLADEKNYYLKSLAIKEQHKDVGMFSFSHTYFKLGAIAFNNTQYDQAQHYFEQALIKRLASDQLVDADQDKDPGLFISMQQTRLEYLRTNNEGTIDIFEKLAQIHRIKKEYDLAKTYYSRALSASEETFGKEDKRTLALAELVKQVATQSQSNGKNL